MIILLEHFKSKFQALPVTFFTASVAFLPGFGWLIPNIAGSVTYPAK
jgi:hypothetical protein